jgi:MoaA/NifB/PqqE/SkfB family radical SAM enzyme
MLNNLVIITTMRCDLKCNHCLRGYPKDRADFPMDLLDKLLTESMPFGVKHVALTGGEPCFHPNFAEMVQKIIAYGYTWSFVSNGQKAEPYLKIMEEYKDKTTHVTLSIDGATADTHDFLRARKGAFNKVIESAKQYVQLGYKLIVSSSLNQRNKNEVAEIVELANVIGAKVIRFSGIIPTSWNEEYVLNDNESMELYQQIIKLRKKSDIYIKTVSSLITHGGVSFCDNLNSSEISFNPSGEMIFCCDTIANGAVIGSLYEYSFSELLNIRLEKSHFLQAKRIGCIAIGDIGEKFDTCSFCNLTLI